MSKEDRELEEYGKRLLEPLRAAPPIDPLKAQEIKKNYLLHAENLRNELNWQPGSEKSGTSFAKRPVAWKRLLAGVLMALVILVGSSATVYASQSSLPGEPLYLIKSFSEDFRLSLATSPGAKLDLTLHFTDRRIGEITTLLTGGKVLPEHASERFSGELENALFLAAQMEDSQLQSALGEINSLAENQGMTLEELIDKLPEQAEPAVSRMKQRLQEQVELSLMGKSDPQAFRLEIRERQRLSRELHKSIPASDESVNTTLETTTTPAGNQGEEKQQENGDKAPSEVPGHENIPPGQNKDTPGNGNHEPGKTTTP